MATGQAPVGVTVVLGGQWGDEGKGKLVDMLAEKADYVCRCQVMSNWRPFSTRTNYCTICYGTYCVLGWEQCWAHSDS